MNHYVEIAECVALAGLVVWMAFSGWPHVVAALAMLALVHGYLRVRERAASPPTW